MLNKSSVVVGISGGVDSSVAAFLLKKAGCEVHGVIFKQVNGPCDDDDDRACCSASAVEEAQAVCRALDIQLHVLDLRKLFDEKVIQPTHEAYDLGRSPSPCLTCNSTVRSVQLNKARLVLQADYFATGHYFMQRRDEDNTKLSHAVLRGADKEKDQSYMVALVKKEFFPYWLTPCGAFLKTKVRQIASELDLPTAHNPDSQDLCFKHLLKDKERSVIRDGKEIGKVSKRATPGQRRGFGGGLTVINVDANNVYVDNRFPARSEAELGPINLLVDKLPVEIDVQLRSHSKTVKASVDGQRLILAHENLLTPGQVAVFYDGEQLLGGAEIK